MHRTTSRATRARRATSVPIATLALLTTWAPSATPVTAQSSAQHPHAAHAAQQDSAQALLDARVANGVVGVAAVTMRAGHQYRAAGMTAGAGTTPDSLTVFEIGSVAKALTGLLLAEMAARGEVSVDDAVSRHLPDSVRMPSYDGREVTLADLATHRSGLPRLPTNLMPVDMSNPYAAYDVARLYAFLDEHALRRAPDAEYEYSNLGAGLLGHVLALVAGRPYEELVIERILGPLGMHDTRITPTPSMRERLATGHNAAGDATPHWQFDALAGAGGWLSTAADLRRLVAAAIDPPAGPLGEAFAQATRPRAETGQPGLRIGLGWHILGADDDPVIWHNGQTGGSHAFVGYAPAHGAGVVTLANSSVSLDGLALQLLRMQVR